MRSFSLSDTYKAAFVWAPAVSHESFSISVLFLLLSGILR